MKRSIKQIQFVFVAVCWGLASNVSADMVWLKGDSQPRFGTIVSKTAASVQFREFNSNDPNAVPISRDQIEAMVTNIDTQRLSELRPNDWPPYRDYAEELAVQKQDPVARELAIRLYLIAANGSTGELRDSCLIGLISLANSAQRRAQFQLLRQLMVGRGDGTDRQSDETDQPSEKTNQELLLKIIRLIRQEQPSAALELLEKLPEEQPSSTRYPSISLPYLKRLTSVKHLDSEQLLQLLQTEMQLVDGTTRTSETKNGWSNDAQLPAQNNIDLPNFQNVTPYDPSASRYRNGAWVRAE